MENKFAYKSEEDKCYGAAGMAVAVVIFDGESQLASIDLDAEAPSMFSMTEDFYFAGNPGVSARSAWNRILGNFNISMALTIANIMCRRIVLSHSQMDAETRQALRQLIVEVGKESCQLEEDETSRLYDKNYTYLHRIFNHMGVQSLVNDFADLLKRRRQLSRLEVMEALRALSSL